MQNAETILTVSGLVDRVNRSGFAMAAVCRKAGVAQSTPSRWKMNDWEPKQRTLRSLDAALDELIQDRDTAAPARA